MVGFALNVDAEVKTAQGSEDAEAVFFHIGGTLSRSLIKIAGNLPLPLPKSVLGAIGSLNRFSTTLDFNSLKELQAARGSDAKPLFDKAKIAAKLASKFFVPPEKNPFAELTAQVYYAIQENLKFVQLIHLVSAEVDLEIKINAQKDWNFQTKLPNRAEVEDARESLKTHVRDIESLQQAVGRPDGEMEGWLLPANGEEPRVFVRWIDKSKFGKDRQAEYRVLSKGLTTSETFFRSFYPTAEIPKVIASGEDDKGAWHVLSWAHEIDWEANKPLSLVSISPVTAEAARSATAKLVRMLPEVHTKNWSIRYIAQSDVYIGMAPNRQVHARILRADNAIQGDTISSFAEPQVSSSFDVRPPEMTTFQDYDKRVDIWAVAVFSYALMNGGKEPLSTRAADGAPGVDLSPIPVAFISDETKEWFTQTIAPVESRCSVEQARDLPYICFSPWSLSLPEDTPAL